MNEGRFTVLPEARLKALRPEVERWLRQAAAQCCGGGFDEVFDAGMRTLLSDCFRRLDADEGTVWLLDETSEFLIPRYNSGPNAARFVGQHQQSVGSGMISMVLATEQPICENQVHRSTLQDTRLDEKLGLRTCAMLAVPLAFIGEIRGVVSCVQLAKAGGDADGKPGFRPHHLATLESTVGIVSRLLEARLISLCLDLETLTR
ncbi:MAG: GAF domain-containing protein [Chthoniobacteraceae bacterium]